MNEPKIWMAISLAFVLLGIGFGFALQAVGQNVTYCKNYETGEIIITDNGVCPYPTVQI